MMIKNPYNEIVVYFPESIFRPMKVMTTKNCFMLIIIIMTMIIVSSLSLVSLSGD